MKTQKDHKIAGTYRKDRDPTVIVTVLGSIPKPPSVFSKHEKEFYNNTCQDLLGKGTLTTDSLRGVIYHAIFYHTWFIAAEKIRVNGYSQVSEKTGWEQMSPDLTACEKCIKVLQTFSNTHGLNPVSNSKVKSTPPKVKNDLDRLREKTK